MFSFGGGSQQALSFPSSVTSQSITMNTQSTGAIDESGMSSTVITSKKNSTSSTSVVNPYFHTILYPYKSGAQQPTVATQQSSNGTCFKVSWPNYDDYSVFRHGSGNVSTSTITTDAKLTLLRKTTSGQITSFSMGEGTSLTDNGTMLVQTYGIISTVMCSGTKVAINGNVSDFSIYAPNATSVEINGSIANFIKAGNYIESATISHNRNWSSSVTINFNTTISAGVTLQFAPYTSLLCNAKLTVNGTPASPVIFTGSNWYGVTLSGSGANNSQLSYATINNVLSYGGSALIVSNAIGATIDHCTITNNVNYGTCGIGLSNAGSPNISYNTITNNGGYGISYYNTSGDVWKNTIQNNSYGGIRLSNSSPNFGHNGFYAYYGNNLVTGGSYGIYADYYSYPYVGSQYNSYYGYNSIYNNSTKRVRASLSDVLAEQNWWGSSSPLSSWFEAVNNSIIEYYPWLYSPPGQQAASFAEGGTNSASTIALTTTSSATINECWNARDAMLLSKPDQAVEILSTILKNTKDELLIERALAEFAILMQLYPEDKSVRSASFVFKDQMYQTDIAKLHLARILSISGDKSKALQIYKDSKGNDFSKPIYKIFSLNEFYENLSSDNLTSAKQNLDDMQKYFGTDTEVKEAAWLYKILKNNSGMRKDGNNDDGNAQAIVSGTVSEIRLENYPNPFNPKTTIVFALPEAENVRLVVYDYLGREVAVLVNGFVQNGKHEVQFDATNLASGIYFYSLKTGNHSIIKKMLVLK
ncbi:MAG: T9SS type A sorting domain-containing protein [Bacteroidetes bacterium]|nr:T9SS type A sorting domain-containing protein [Bacteroidota bacterium]